LQVHKAENVGLYRHTACVGTNVPITRQVSTCTRRSHFGFAKKRPGTRDRTGQDTQDETRQTRQDKTRHDMTDRQTLYIPLVGTGMKWPYPYYQMGDIR
jgi:hypothetical protein